MQVIQHCLHIGPYGSQILFVVDAGAMWPAITRWPAATAEDGRRHEYPGSEVFLGALEHRRTLQRGLRRAPRQGG